MAYSKTTWANDTVPAINADNLNKIEQGIEDGVAGADETADIRVGANGIIYASAGDSIRNQVSDLHGVLDSIADYDVQYIDHNALTMNYRYSLSGTTVTKVTQNGYLITTNAVLLSAGTYKIIGMDVNFTYIHDLIANTYVALSTYTGTSFVEASVTFNNPVEIYITGNQTKDYPMICTGNIPNPYTYGIYSAEIKRETLILDETLKDETTAPKSSVVGKYIGVNNYQYINSADIVPNKYYFNNPDVGASNSNGNNTLRANNLPAGTYRLRGIWTNFSWVQNISTGVWTRLEDILGANSHYDGLLTLAYDFNMGVTFSSSFDTLAYGKAVFASGNIYQMGTERVEGYYDIRANSEHHYETTGPVYYVLKDGSGDFTKISDAVNEAVKHMNSIVYIGSGFYNIFDDLGADYFTDKSYLQNWGIKLYNNIHLIFSSGAKIEANYTGSDADVMKNFSVFNATSNRPAGKGFTIENANIEASNIRYCVHDERVGAADPYTNKYINCRFSIDNSGNTEFSPESCIGTGLGNNGYIDVDGCVFKRGHYSVHNTSGASAWSNINIKNCAFAAGYGISYEPMGSSTYVSELLVTNCNMGKDIIKVGTGTNIKLIEWNNNIIS